MWIGLDFDGVIADCGKLKSDVAKILFQVDIPPAKFKRELLLQEGWLSADQYTALQEVIYGTREYGLRLRPIPGAISYILAMLREQHRLVVITSRSGVYLDIAREWCSTYKLDLDLVGVGYRTSKAEAAAGLDIFVDDDLHKLEQLVDTVPHRLLFTQPYNVDDETGLVASRVNSWAHLYNVISRAG